MKEYLSILSQMFCSLCLCYDKVMEVYFQFFAKKIIYIYCYNTTSSYIPPKLVYSYWMSYLYPLSMILSNEMYCPSGSLLEIVHNIDNEQVTTIMKKDEFNEYIPNPNKLSNKLDTEVYYFKNKYKHRLKNIMLVNANDNEIITDFFKNIAHSFYMTQINTHDFIQFIGKRNKKIDLFNKCIITVVDDTFDEHVFKEDDIIVW